MTYAMCFEILGTTPWIVFNVNGRQALQTGQLVILIFKKQEP